MHVQNKPSFGMNPFYAAVKVVKNLFFIFSAHSRNEIVTAIDEGIVGVIGMRFPCDLAKKVREKALCTFEVDKEQKFQRRINDLKATLYYNKGNFIDSLFYAADSLSEEEEDEFFSAAKDVIETAFIERKEPKAFLDELSKCERYYKKVAQNFSEKAKLDCTYCSTKENAEAFISAAYANTPTEKAIRIIELELNHWLLNKKAYTPKLGSELLTISMYEEQPGTYLQKKLSYYQCELTGDLSKDLNFLRLALEGPVDDPERLKREIENFKSTPIPNLKPTNREFPVETENYKESSGSATSIGPKRVNEDVVKMFSYAGCEVRGIFDGHSGVDAARHVADTIESNFVPFPLERLHDYAYSTLKSAKIKGGTCSLYSIQKGEELQIVNVGDSLATLVANDGTCTPCSIAASPRHPYFQERSARMGRYIYEGRAVTTNLEMAPKLIPVAVTAEFGKLGPDAVRPDVFTTTTKGQTMLILGSDGLYNALSSEEVAKLGFDAKNGGKTPEETAQVLCKEALRRGSPDNVSVVVQYFS